MRTAVDGGSQQGEVAVAEIVGGRLQPRVEQRHAVEDQLFVGEGAVGTAGRDKRGQQVLARLGPAFRDVARRYRGQDGIEAKLVEKLRRGGSGSWGPLAMPPNPDLPAADATTLVRWVLGL